MAASILDGWRGRLARSGNKGRSGDAAARLYLYPVFGDEPVGKLTTRVLEELYAELRRCSERCDGRSATEHRVVGPHDCRVTKHRRPPGRPPAAGYPEHGCSEAGCKVVECQPHRCEPLAPATIRRIHFAIRGC